jgi:lycopene cyclase domain-containing protein
MDYILFHLVFILPPLAGLLFLLSDDISEAWKPAGIMIVLAVVYTTPWDAFLISQGVWFYGETVVLADLFGVPLGEYLFFVFQTLGVSLFAVHRGFDTDIDMDVFTGYGPAAVLLGLSGAGALMVFTGPSASFYMGSILLWASPVLALQWLYGADVLAANLRAVVLDIFVPVLYLCLVDAFAIRNGLWTIAPDTSTGLGIMGLPLEEAVFFMATSAMVVQGVILYVWTVENKSVQDLRRFIS